MFFYLISMFLFLLLALFLCGVILMQESKTSGLGASFGGELNQSVFGVATADVLKKFTGYLVAIFFGASVLLSMWTAGLGRSVPRVEAIEQVQDR